MLSQLKLGEILVVLATLLSPLIAVQVTRFLDEAKETRGRKLRIFKTLMATRSSRLSPDHIFALNSIDVDFSGSRKFDVSVREAWKAYLDRLERREGISDELFQTQAVDSFLDLLWVMGKGLGYKFDKTHLKNASYYPQHQVVWERDNTEMRHYLLATLKGELPLRMSVTNFPAHLAVEPATPVLPARAITTPTNPA